ncbi:PREDICTED: flavin-containing monooxygenase FMO GS-OX3-like [Camelina sativa]|uniref:Flavin-containing monooxygenase n=1 Tax=Camelina sativa TaxID=90675 RepID=A0ABM1Q7L5_CAMSA|nr:PREDICTED: flavin-containing monooxygenase FMO GS-OX3-like [Camelina sativa]
MAPGQTPISSKHVAVIGAGAAGLITSRELRREGHSVFVFEREKQVGGLWVYTPKSESDPLSLDPTRSKVHSSIYDSLRTNVPRESMGVRDFPFLPRFDEESRDPRRYPNHREVLAYVQEYAREFKIEEMIRFETEVVRVEPVIEKWRVQSKNPGGDFDDEIFDAVVVCTGHYTEPNVPHIPGKEISGIVFVMFEIQSKWVAAVLSGRVTLPPPDKMMEDINEWYASLDVLGIPKRHTHTIGRIQSEYLNWVAKECGCELVERWRAQEVDGGYVRLVVHPETYRDEWDDDELIEEAYHDFSRKKLISFDSSYYLENVR